MSKQAKRLRKIVSFMLAAIVAVSCFSVSAAAAETDSVSSSEKVNYIANSLDWDKLYAYEWDSDGNPLLGEWPGTRLTEKQVDLYGYDAYSYTVQDGAVGLIISDGRKNMTVDIKDFSVPEYLISEVRETEYSKFNVIAANTISFEQDDIVFLYGDTNLDQKISVSDSTAIAFQLAQLPDSELSYLQKALSDVDGDGDVTIADVTSIQLELAELKTESRTGKKCKTWDSETEYYEYPLQFICPDDWNFAYLYAWDNNNEPLVGEFPGILINNAPNDSGELVAHLPYGCAGYIFSDGGNRQTVDISPYDSAPNGVVHRLTGTKDSLGHYDVKPVRKGILDPPPYGYIRFINTPGWENVYVYAWDCEGDRLTDSFPGSKMEFEGFDESGNSMYLVENDYRAYGYAFCSGDGEQTVDAATNATIYRPSGKEDGFWVFDDIGRSKTVKAEQLFTCDWGWKEAYCYWWNDYSRSEKWPGTKMTYIGMNDYGQDQYTVKIPITAKYIVFSNGEDVQTVDLEFDPNVTGWYINGFQDGKATCGTW